MPYSDKQCAKFAVMAKRGEKVPADWKEHCKGKKRGAAGAGAPRLPKRPRGV